MAREKLDVGLAKTDGACRTYDAGFYAVKCSGEVITHPHLRMMSFRSEHYQKLVRAFLRSFLEVDEALNADNAPGNAMVVAIDGGKYGGEGTMLMEPMKWGRACFKRQPLHIHVDDTAMEERRDRMKLASAFSLPGLEVAHCFTYNAIQVQCKKRDHYPGSSATGIIGPVAYVAEDSPQAWLRTVKEKKQIYGSSRIAPGGRTPGISAETAKLLHRKDDYVEPVFFFGQPSIFFEDVIKTLSLTNTVTALTIGDGAVAMASMEKGVPCIGVCLTEAHLTGVRIHLANQVFQGFRTEGSTFYQADLAKKLKDLGVTGSLAKVAEKAQQDDETKAKAKTKARQDALQKKRLASKLEGGENQDPPKRGKGSSKDQPKYLIEHVLVPKNNKPNMQDKMKAALKAFKDGAAKTEEDGFSEGDAPSEGEESECQE